MWRPDNVFRCFVFNVIENLLYFYFRSIFNLDHHTMCHTSHSTLG